MSRKIEVVNPQTHTLIYYKNYLQGINNCHQGIETKHCN